MGLQILGSEEFHHFPCNHWAGILVLTGDEVAVDHPVVGERVTEPGDALEDRTGST